MKKSLLFISVVLLSSAISLTSCSKKEGCTNAIADNWDRDADVDDGSCRCTSVVTFDNKRNEDYTITSTNGETKVIAAYGVISFDVTGVGNCDSYTITDESNGGIYIGSFQKCACDTDANVDID